VTKVFTAKDIPGDKYVGLIYQDWPLMIAEGETTRYIGECAGRHCCRNREIARAAAKLIVVDYEILEPVVDPSKH